jgi:hypothetical protein
MAMDQILCHREQKEQFLLPTCFHQVFGHSSDEADSHRKLVPEKWGRCHDEPDRAVLKPLGLVCGRIWKNLEKQARESLECHQQNLMRNSVWWELRKPECR